MPVRLAQISDCHLFGDTDKCGYRQINPYQSLRQVLNEVAVQSPDWVIASGDISGDGSLQSYQHFKTLLAEFGLSDKTVIIPGNHDDELLLADVFGAQPTHLQLEHWQLCMLNSRHTGALGYVAEESLQLAAANINQGKKPTLIYVHHHPLDTDSWMDKHQWQNRQLFLDWLQQQPQVKAVAYGHIHYGGERIYQGKRFWSCPSTCWQWQLTPDFGVSDEAPGFRLTTLEPEQQFHTQIIQIQN